MTEQTNGSRPVATTDPVTTDPVTSTETTDLGTDEPSAGRTDGGAETAQMGTAELLHRAYEQFSTLVRDEIALAKAELTVKSKMAGMGAGLFGAAGALAFFGVACLVATAVIALDLVLPSWLAALIVGLGLVLLAAMLALVGRGSIRAATPPYPSEAAQGLSADLDAVKAAVGERGRHEH